MKQTPNLSLKKPELTDVVNIEDLNQNFDTIDTEIKSVKDRADEAFQSASDGKSKIATAITGKGVPTSSSDTFQKMATNINAIETDKTSNDTAVAGDILAPKTAHARGIELTGMMPNNGSVGIKNLTTEGAEYTIPSGYHNGLGKVKAIITGLIASVIKAGTTVGGVLGTFTSDADAVANDMESGKSAYVKGLKVIGNIPVRSAVNGNGSGINHHLASDIANNKTSVYFRPVPKETFGKTIYDGDVWIEGVAPHLLSENILAGKSIFGVWGGIPDRNLVWNDPVVKEGIPGALFVVPPRGYYSGDPNLHVNGGVLLEEPYFIPSNIVSGKTIFGVTGNASVGKKYDTGTSTSFPTTVEGKFGGLTYYSNFKCLTVTGLTFKPSVVRVKWARASGYYYITTGTDKATAGSHTVDGLTLCEIYEIRGNACTTVQGGFTIALDPTVASATWEAWE